jgi:hypothetical protein
MDSKSAAVDVWSKLAVGYSGTDLNHLGLGIEIDLIEVLQGHLLDCAVGNAVEGVTRPESLEMRMAEDDASYILDCIGQVKILCAVCVISSPVYAAFGWSLGEGYSGKQSTGSIAPEVLRNTLLSTYESFQRIPNAKAYRW